MRRPAVFVENISEVDVFAGGRMGGLTAKELKALTGRSVPAIRNACERAGVPLRDGLYDREAALAAIESEIDPARVAGHGSRGLGDARETEVSSYATARARAEAARAEKLELEVLQTRGALVEREAVTEAGRNLVFRVREDLLALGQRVAPKIIGMTDEATIAKTINEQVRLLLGAMAEAARFEREVLA